MKKLLLGLAGALLLNGVGAHAAVTGSTGPAAAPAAPAGGPAIKDNAPGRYTVVPGDTLWDISGRFLNSPWRWRELWLANQQITNPDLIYPGDVLVLCLVNNKAAVALDQGSGCSGIPGGKPYPTATAPGTPPVTGSGRDFVLHPQIRSEPLSVAIPTIPLAAIKAYLTNSRVINYATLQNSPYIMAGPAARVVAGAGDTVYARGSKLATGTFGVYRSGERYIDPDTGEVLGYEATAIGAGKIADIENGVGSVAVTKTYDSEVRIGDHLLPLEELAAQPNFMPRNPDHVKPGRVIRIFGALESAAVNNVIVLTRGRRDGVRLGDTFDVFHRGAVVEDSKTQEMVRLPSSSEGMAMVFRTFDKVSYAIILKASGVVSVGDEIRPPIATDND